VVSHSHWICGDVGQELLGISKAGSSELHFCTPDLSAFISRIINIAGDANLNRLFLCFCVMLRALDYK
jgi:hypothetical protein